MHKLAIVLFIIGATNVAQSGHHKHKMDHGEMGHVELPGLEGGFMPHSVFHLDTHWLNETGDHYELSDLSPHPVVSAMIYTSCEFACPLIIAKMLTIYDGLDEDRRKDTRFVLFSFDPERDIPSKLNPYKKASNIDKDEWMVLTSTNDDAPLELAVVLGVRYKKVGGTGDFAHSNIITVLDGDGVPVYQMVGLDKPTEEAIEAIEHASH